jgi:hypothetical protein
MLQTRLAPRLFFSSPLVSSDVDARDVRFDDAELAD